MEASGNLTKHPDGSKDINMGLSNGTVAGNAFVSGYRDGNPKAFPRPTGDSFAAAGAGVSVSGGPGTLGMQATHQPKFGNQLTTSYQAEILNNNGHKVGVNAFTTRTHREGPIPNYSTQGGGVGYSYQDKVGVGAFVANTPSFNHQQQSVSGYVNLHKTPTSSLDFSMSSGQTKSSLGRSPWQHQGSVSFKTQF